VSPRPASAVADPCKHGPEPSGRPGTVKLRCRRRHPSRPHRCGGRPSIDMLLAHPLQPPTLAGPWRRFEATSPEIPFRPRGFAPPRRFPPRAELRACCIPLPILGFAAFPYRSRRLPKQGRRSGTFPQRNSHPSKETPRRQPHRVTAAVALLPLARRASRRPFRDACCQDCVGTPPFTVASASGPCSATESVTAPCRRRRGRSSPPLGFVPLRGRPASTDRSPPLADHPLSGDRAPVRAWHPTSKPIGHLRWPPRGASAGGARHPFGRCTPHSREGCDRGCRERTARRPKP